MRHAILCAALTVIAATAWAGAEALAGEAQNLAIKPSDVVFMYPGSPELFREYSATVVAWGGRPWSGDQKAVEEWRRRIADARALGVRYRGNVDFRVAFAGMIDFDPNFMNSVCRTLDGQPITVPWLWDRKHKGNPAYWFCTNSPSHREYLKSQARLALSADMDGLQIDDYGGTAGTHSQGGCFCRWCMAGFRDYLRQNVSPQALGKLGINSLDGFDYGEFLRGRGVTTEQFRKESAAYPPKLPLAQEFVSFEFRTSTAWVAEFRAYAEKLAGHPLAVSVNSPVSGPNSALVAPVASYFVGEVRHDAASLAVPSGPVWSYKLADGLDRPLAATASGEDWAFVKEKHVPGLVRTWVAQAYAFGHQLMAPTRQWCYTKEKGAHWYESAPGDYDYLYQFVREHADLFDGYESVASIGLLYSNTAFRRWHVQAEKACAQMALKNVPFRLVPAGDDWMADRLRAEDLKGLKALVVTEPTDLDAAQQAVLEGAKALTVIWPDEKRLFELAPPEIAVDGASNITVAPRARAGDPTAPFVCHLVNRNYVAQKDSMEPQKDFTLRLARSLFGADVDRATLYAPRQAPVELKVSRSPEGVTITVPELDLWAVLKLDRAG